MKDYLNLLSEIGHKKTFKKKYILFFEGEMPSSFFVLIKGKIRIYKSNDSGEQTLHVFSPVSFIAEMPTFQQIPYPASAVCEEDCEILQIDSKLLIQKLTQGHFAILFIQSLLHKIKILEKTIAQNNISLKERLILFLKQNQELLPTLSQRKIAQQLNTTAESLSRILRTLKSEGFLSTHKGKIILTESFFKILMEEK